MSTSTVTHEAYAFVCMSCGHGWEHEYEIHHVVDLHGEATVQYHLGGERVPSPLTSPRCPSCESERVRFLPAGRVDRADRARTEPLMRRAHDRAPREHHWRRHWHQPHLHRPGG